MNQNARLNSEIVHLLVIVQSNKRCTVQGIKIKKISWRIFCVLKFSEFFYLRILKTSFGAQPVS